VGRVPETIFEYISLLWIKIVIIDWEGEKEKSGKPMLKGGHFPNFSWNSCRNLIGVNLPV